MTDHKLPSKKFDPIYDACDKRTGKDSRKLSQHFSQHVYRENKDLYEQIGGDGTIGGNTEEYYEMNRSMLEAYRTGEIRDAGEYHGKETMKVRITKGHGWYMDYVGKIYEVFKEPSKYWLDQYGKVAYAVVDLDFPGVINDSNCTIVDTCKDPPWYQLDPAVFDELVDDECVFFRKILEVNPRLWDTLPSVGAAKSVVEQYKAGILRQGGPLEVCETCGHQLPDRS